jgi:hypothetical protein
MIITLFDIQYDHIWRSRSLFRPSTRQFTNRPCMLCYTLFLQRVCVLWTLEWRSYFPGIWQEQIKQPLDHSLVVLLLLLFTCTRRAFLFGCVLLAWRDRVLDSDVVNGCGTVKSSRWMSAFRRKLLPLTLEWKLRTWSCTTLNPWITEWIQNIPRLGLFFKVFGGIE